MQNQNKPLTTEQLEARQKATQTCLRWLQSDAGREALAWTRAKRPVWASNPITLIGYAMGHFARQISTSTLDMADVEHLQAAL